MKRLCLGLILVAGAILSAEEFHFVNAGKPACELVLPATPGEFEKRAADDIRDFLKQMTGAELKILKEGDSLSLPAIYVGQTDFAARHGADFNEYAEEESHIIPADGNLAVTGSKKIGSYYGVWKLLNRLGIWSLTMEQDMVPQRQDAVLEVKNERFEPSFASRVIYDGRPIHYLAVGTPKEWFDRYDLWLLRNGINARQHHVHTPYYVGKMSDIPHNPIQHTFSLYVPLWLFDSHPEYFAMDKTGKRCKPENFTARGGLCLSNKEMQKTMLESLRSMIKKHRAERKEDDWPILYDITPLDLAQDCNCDECKAIVAEEGSYFGLLIRCINFVAENIRKEYPQIIIRTFSYGTASGGSRTKPADNVIVMGTDLFVKCDTFKPLSHEFNKPARENIELLSSMGCKLSFWDYWNMSMYNNPPRVDVVFDTIAPDLRYLWEHGVRSFFIEAEIHEYKPQNFMDLEFFVASQLMMDVNQDAEALAKVYIEGCYGPAAPEMLELFNSLREGVRKYPELQPGMRTKIWDYMTPEFMYNTWKMLEDAAAKAENGSRCQRRIQDESLSVLWMVLTKRGEYLKYFNDKGVKRSVLMDQCRDRSRAHLLRYGATKPMVDYQYARTQKNLENELARMDLAPLPVPPQFKDVDPVNLRVFGVYQYQPLQDYNTAVVDDPDSPTGKALKATDADPAKHGAKTVVRDPKGKWAFRSTEFGLCNRGIVIDPVAQDEKYHWYVMPKVTLKEESWFWGYIWHLQIVLDAAYQIDDGNSDENLWDCHFSVKFTGPAYVPGSTKENAVWVDTIVLTRPGETKIKPVQ